MFQKVPDYIIMGGRVGQVHHNPYPGIPEDFPHGQHRDIIGRRRIPGQLPVYAGSNLFPRWNKYKALTDYNEQKYQIEEFVRNGGFRYWTFLHPCLFMECFEEKSVKVMAPELKNGVLFGILKPDTPIKWTCGDNTSQFARAAFESPEKFNKKDINVAGDELSMSQAAQTLSRVCL